MSNVRSWGNSEHRTYPSMDGRALGVDAERAAAEIALDVALDPSAPARTYTMGLRACLARRLARRAALISTAYKNKSRRRVEIGDGFPQTQPVIRKAGRDCGRIG